MSSRLLRAPGARIALAVVALGFTLVSGPAAAETKPTLPLQGKDGARPNVLLLTVDTLRMDHLGAYGYRLPTSPAIDQLAGEGVLFTDAITPVPMTAPALASLLTGHHVQHHHVTQNTGTFPKGLSSLAEAFAEAGYDTAGFYGNEAVEEFGRGFDVWEEFPRRVVPGGLEMADDLGVNLGLAWLKQAKAPWFLWLHFIDPHGPYDSSPARLSKAFEYPDDPALDKELETSEQNWVFGAVPKYQGLPNMKRAGDYVRRYDGEILGTDLQIGRLRSWLEEDGKLDDTLIVFTADHGESLVEDDYYFQHGKMLNESSVRVPLVLRHRSLPAGSKVDAPVSLIDLYPTLASLVGLTPPKSIPGVDVSASIFGAPAEERLRIMYTVTPDLRVSVMRGPWRMMGRPPKKNGGVQIDEFPFVALYDVTTYPEQRVAAPAKSETVKELKKELVDASKRVRSFRPPPVDLSKKQEDRLRALGYID
ncbi:MAG: sulfatase [Candidatus Binatia bacterium]|nr:sulfatase [Candidatus Binatia bacterium]